MTTQGSTAAATAFCQARIDGPGDHHLWIDGNGKITATNGTLDAPKPNAFSLRHVVDCPGATPTCQASCYVHGLKQAVPDTYALYAHNATTIRTILLDPDLAAAWALQVSTWITEHASGGFRWHVSGDIFSLDYAAWIAAVCQASPTVGHWIYTRSFNYLAPLGGAKNLALNLSADIDNAEQAFQAAFTYNARICYMTADGHVPELLPGDVIFPDYVLRHTTKVGADWFANLAPRQKKMVCMIDFYGKAEHRRCGPCSRCLYPK